MLVIDGVLNKTTVFAFKRELDPAPAGVIPNVCEYVPAVAIPVSNQAVYRYLFIDEFYLYFLSLIHI